MFRKQTWKGQLSFPHISTYNPIHPEINSVCDAFASSNTSFAKKLEQRNRVLGAYYVFHISKTNSRRSGVGFLHLNWSLLLLYVHFNNTTAHFTVIISAKGGIPNCPKNKQILNPKISLCESRFNDWMLRRGNEDTPVTFKRRIFN